MLRLILPLILLVHGLIHLLGFIHEFKLGTLKDFSGKTLIPLPQNFSYFAGILWLFAALAFIAVAIIYFLRIDWWWILLAFALVLSQKLIILYWYDAKFGTIANIILLIPLLVGYGAWSFKSMVDKEIPLFTIPSASSEIITEEHISQLPPVVRNWLISSGMVGKPRIDKVYLTQKCEMRSSPDGSWIPLTAKQYFTVPTPGFHWTADVKIGPFIDMVGRDILLNGEGHMLIKALSLYPVVDSKGPELNQGTLLRYLAEILWFPSAALSDYIRWEQLNEHQAKATITDHSTTASGIFTFNDKYEPVSFEAQRYYSGKDGSTLETWFIAPNKNAYKTFDGIKIPYQSSVTWKLKSGDFNWLNVEITSIKYN